MQVAITGCLRHGWRVAVAENMPFAVFNNHTFAATNENERELCSDKNRHLQ